MYVHLNFIFRQFSIANNKKGLLERCAGRTTLVYQGMVNGR